MLESEFLVESSRSAGQGLDGLFMLTALLAQLGVVDDLHQLGLRSELQHGDDFIEFLGRVRSVQGHRIGQLQKLGLERAEEMDACKDVKEAREEACDVLGEDRYDPDPLLDEGIQFVSLEIIAVALFLVRGRRRGISD